MTAAQRLKKITERLTRLSDALENAREAAGSPTAIESAITDLEYKALLLARLVPPAPEQPPRGRMLVDATTGRRGRRMF
jgi:hypothetical protein